MDAQLVGVALSHGEVAPSGELFIGRAGEGSAKIRSSDHERAGNTLAKNLASQTVINDDKKTNRKGDISHDSCNHFPHNFVCSHERMRHSIIVSQFRLTRGAKDGY